MDIIAILLLALIWGASFLFIKVGLNGGMSPFLLASWRLTVGAMVMWLVVLVRGFTTRGRTLKQIPHDRGTWGKLAMVGLLNNAVPFALIAWGEQRINSGLASIFNASMPIFTVIVAHFFTHDDRIVPAKALGVLIGLLGVAVVIIPTTSDLTGEALGCLAVILAAMSYASATVYVKKKLTSGTDPIATGAGQLSMAILWLLPFTLVSGAISNITSLPGDAILAVSALGFLGTGVAYIIYFLLIQHAKATQMSLVTYLLPVTALIYGAVFLHEQITGYALAGFVLIVIGIALVNQSNRALT